MTCCPRVCLTQTKIDQHAASFELLRKLELKQQSPELAKALVLMAEAPELPEEPEELAPETSQALVTIASDAAYNKSLQTIMQHLTSQEAPKLLKLLCSSPVTLLSQGKRRGVSNSAAPFLLLASTPVFTALSPAFPQPQHYDLLLPSGPTPSRD